MKLLSEDSFPQIASDIIDLINEKTEAFATTPIKEIVELELLLINYFSTLGIKQSISVHYDEGTD